MKIEIESVTNGYIITIPSEYEEDIEKKDCRARKNIDLTPKQIEMLRKTFMGGL